ncbi:MAG: hypothetical protein U0K57_03705 [Lachnospiraceae bacterium]|nr:hypothetical protein [Lachnospiraceae bacterium]
MDKIRKLIAEIGEVMELILAGMVLIAVVFAVIGYIPHLEELWHHRAMVEDLSHTLEAILTIVIGTEFIKMLCKPNSENVTEVLIFLIARHMVLSHISAVDSLLSVIGITILYVLRHFLVHEDHEMTFLDEMRKKFFKKSADAAEKCDSDPTVCDGKKQLIESECVGNGKD